VPNLPNDEQFRNDIFYAAAAGNIVRQSGDQLVAVLSNSCRITLDGGPMSPYPMVKASIQITSPATQTHTQGTTEWLALWMLPQEQQQPQSSRLVWTIDWTSTAQIWMSPISKRSWIITIWVFQLRINDTDMSTIQPCIQGPLPLHLLLLALMKGGDSTLKKWVFERICNSFRVWWR